jgi:hypothetical protein
MESAEATGRTSRLFQSEPAPRAFISSVMTPELEPIRTEVIAALDHANNIVPWAFEASPASAEPVVEEYLRQVREAALVIWLAGESTTDPVEAEIGEALAANRRLLVFVLPTQHREQRTQALLDRVKDVVRYRELLDTAEIGAEVRAAVADEISRALAGAPAPGPAGRLSNLWRASHARCIQKWQAAGLTSDLAIELAGDLEVGALPGQFLPNHHRPLTVLVGEAGSGKSLACERYIQNAIAEASEAAGAPIPAFVEAAEVAGDLKGRAVALAAEGLGDPERQGVRLVIDGADEAGDRSPELLAEARELVRAWPNSQVLLSTRPLSAYTSIEETIKIPALSDDDALRIVGIGAGREIAMGERAGWPEPIKKAVEVPFFGLLIGERLRRNQDLQTSRAELLAELAESSIGSHEPETMALLRQLAVRSIERGGTHVPLSELGGLTQISELQASRLVVINKGMAWFPLALAAQWLAAQALAEGARSGEQLAENPRDLELWRYPLAMLVGNFTHEQVSLVIGPLAERQPGFLSQVVDESIARWSGDAESAVPLQGAGVRIRETMPYWLRGFGQMGSLLLPGFDAATDQLPPLGVAQDGPRLAAGWYQGEEQLEDISRLPLELFFSGSETPADRGWLQIRSVEPSAQAAWAWRWTMEEISNTLSTWLGERALPIERSRLERPRVWLASLALLGLAGSYSQPLPITRVRERASELRPQADPKLRGYGDHAIDLDRLIEILDRLEDEGHGTVLPDRLEVEPSGRLYIPGSAKEDVQQGHITDVYQAALETYEELSSGLFSGLSTFMPIAATLPARFSGHLYGRGPNPEAQLSFEWSMFALPLGEKSRAEITVTKSGDPELTGRWREEWIDGADQATESMKALRPDQSRWIGMGFSDHLWYGLGHLAMEEIVYEWLWKDLAHLKLVKGGLPEAHYKTIP